MKEPEVLYHTNYNVCLSSVVGRVLNRFTKDMTIMDDSLPSDAFDFLDVSRSNVIPVYFLVV